MTRWRRIVDGPADGFRNMAADEALLDAARADPDRPPILRLYAWSRPTLSLGRGQRWSPALAARARAHGVEDVVRRPTGGRAVLHVGERTFAVVGSLDRGPLAGGVRAVYAAVRRAVDAAFAELGIEVGSSSERAPSRRGSEPGSGFADAACFRAGEPHEPLRHGRKLAGLAQVRRGRAVLVQASVPLRRAAERARFFDLDPAEAVDLETATGAAVPLTAFDRAWSAGFSRTFGVAWDGGGWSPAELRARRRHEARHRTVAWIREGRSAEILEPGGAAVDPQPGRRSLVLPVESLDERR